MAGFDALDVPKSGISRKLGLASGLVVRLIPRLSGSVSFQRIGLGEYCPAANPFTSGSGILSGIRISVNTAENFLICKERRSPECSPYYPEMRRRRSLSGKVLRLRAS